MARWTLYNCLGCGHSFDAMNNNMPECPECHSYKLVEGHYGAFPSASNRANTGAFTSNSVAARDDATLRNLADTYGMTDMSNAGGQAVKGRPSTVQGKYGVKNYFGVDCPIGDSPVTVSGASGLNPVAIQTGARFAGQSSAPAQVAKMSEVVAEYKG